MTAFGQNVTMFAGDYLELKVPIRTATGGAISPIGLTAKYMAGFPRQIIISKTIGQGILVSVEEGTVVLSIELLPEDTEGKSNKTPYTHEVEITDAEGRVFTVLQGSLTVMKALID